MAIHAVPGGILLNIRHEQKENVEAAAIEWKIRGEISTDYSSDGGALRLEGNVGGAYIRYLLPVPSSRVKSW